MDNIEISKSGAEDKGNPGISKLYAGNKPALAGVILALLALVFFKVPVISSLTLLGGAVFSIIGLFRSPRILAWLGLILTVVNLLVIYNYAKDHFTELI